MPDEGLPKRTLRTGAWVAALFVLVFGLRGQASISVGLAIGAALGLFSLWSLAYAVPRVLHGRSRAKQVLLAGLLLAKLPIYGLVLNYTMGSRQVSALAVLCGVALIPAVLTLKVIGYQMTREPDEASGEVACRNKMA